MKFKHYLTEALNNPYEYFYFMSGANNKSVYKFFTDSKNQYNVYMIPISLPLKSPYKNKKFNPGDIVEISFTIGSGSKETNALSHTGDAFRIFATVKKIIMNYLNSHEIKGFCFSSSLGIKSRVKLYDRFAREIDKITKFKFIKKEETNNYTYYYHFMREDLLKKVESLKKIQKNETI